MEKVKTYFTMSDVIALAHTTATARKSATATATATNIDYNINKSVSDGNVGKAFEIAIRYLITNGHTKTTACAGKGKTDMVRKGISYEIKTNGGRIDNILDSEYVIYAMDICNSTTKGKRRVSPVVVCKSDEFMKVLNECGAIKKVNKSGMFDGHAIQPSNKAFYEWLTTKAEPLSL